MKEELLHTAWKLKRFNLLELKTTQEEPLSIINFGSHNDNAGPDFLNAKVKIGNAIWVGHVEMHTSSSEWNRHKHQHDPAYNNVILHVVFEDDAIVKTKNNQTIPTLILKGRIDDALLVDYQSLLLNAEWIPCAPHFHKVNPFKFNLFLERLLIERLEDKCQLVKTYLKTTKNNWEYVCYKLIMKYFGLKVNKEAFEILSEKLPYGLLIKNSASINQQEAILFGQAGLLHKTPDTYTQKLKKEYLYLQKKHKLQPMTGVEWRFARMRPSNFPTIRLAQVASLYYKTPKFFSQLLDRPSLSHFRALLNVELPTYWNEHYIPGRPSKHRLKVLGEQTIMVLIINAFIPLIFTYGMVKDNQKFKDLAVSLYRQLPSEKNVIIRNWKKLGVEISSSSETQALIQLKLQYCNHHKCLNCQIGQDILFK